VKGKEYFLPYDEYPWFRDARFSEIQYVQLLNEGLSLATGNEWNHC
jgi:hypothetical protein